MLFGALILSMLWLLQTVFLRHFYVEMKTRDVSRVAEKLAGAYGSHEFERKLDLAAYQNSILLYVTDMNGNILYTTDEHAAVTRTRERPSGRGRARDQHPAVRPLPEGYDDFLSRMRASEDGRVRFTAEGGDLGASTLVLGERLAGGAVLFISTPLDPVDVTVSILRTQLIYVTLMALALGLVLAFFLSRRFHRPIIALTRQAKKMAGGEFPEVFDTGFCSELDELSGALSDASRALNKVESLRRELIANVSHDFRTPLTMIKAYTETIRDISGDDREKRERHLSVIADEADRLNALVNDILALNELQSDAALFEPGEIDLSAMIERVRERFQPVFDREGLLLEMRAEPGLTVRGDPRRIEQVLYNLIGNAASYAGGDKTVNVTARHVGGAARVEVSDRGVGIDEDELPLIWERYYKSRTHRRDVAGTGLGLSIVKGILDKHGAKYGVDSALNEGSTFWFELEG